MDDENILTKVPESLKKLVRVTARAFYQPLQVVCLDVLTKYPCVTLSDLVDVLKMHGSQKQLQCALTVLKNDKLVKWLQKMEVQAPEDSAPNPSGKKPTPKMMHYYYINYKQFVNVVKYKLDQMRKNLESKDKMAQNRTSYKCPRCDKTFSDLDIGKLFDLVDQLLKCSFCRNPLEEEKKEENTVDSRTQISKLNEYVKPITDLLRETENLNLAPELLEPEAQSIQKYLQASGSGRRISTSGREGAWTSRSATNLYGESTSVSVNIGDGEQQASNVVVKERPEWLTKSTVYNSDEPVLDEDRAESYQPRHHKKGVSDTDRQILHDLMAYESKQHSVPSLDSSHPQYQEQAQYSSSSSGEEEGEGQEGGASAAAVSWMGGGGGFDDVEEMMEEEESSGDEGYSVRIGERVVPLEEVTDEMVAQMTPEEKERYVAVSRRAWSQADDF